jgi:hypothetical protein
LDTLICNICINREKRSRRSDGFGILHGLPAESEHGAAAKAYGDLDLFGLLNGDFDKGPGGRPAFFAILSVSLVMPTFSDININILALLFASIAANSNRLFSRRFLTGLDALIFLNHQRLTSPKSGLIAKALLEPYGLRGCI